MSKKSDLVSAVAVAAELDLRTAERAVNAVLEGIKAAVAKGERMAIADFGVFERVTRAARKARNPATGAAVDVPEKQVPNFRPGSDFKAAVSGRPE